MAKALRAEVAERHNVDLSHGECLEIVSRQFGVDNWNVLAAHLDRVAPDGEPVAYRTPFSAQTTIPVLRIFSEAAAKDFYVELLGFRLDFGGPVGGEGTPFYGQVSQPGTTLQLAEEAYRPGPGATVDIWMAGLDELRERVITFVMGRNIRIWGPGIWVPDIHQVEWDARVLTLPDPFGNHLRLSEPNDKAAHDVLPRWTLTG